MPAVTPLVKWNKASLESGIPSEKTEENHFFKHLNAKSVEVSIYKVT